MIVKIKNYQRLEDITLELKPGINLISGNSNNGKSSTIRAIRDFVFNKATKDKIRHGEKELEVSLDNAIMNRTNKGTTYSINNETFEKVGKTPLNEIINLFNIKELTVNDVTIKPNFWFQMDKPFLIDKTAGQKHDLIIGAKNDKYLKALKEIKAEISNLTKVEKVSLEKVIDTLKKKNLDTNIKLSQLEGIDELISKILKYEKGKSFIEKNIDIIKSIKTFKENIKYNKECIDKFNSLHYQSIVERYKNFSELSDSICEAITISNEYKTLYYNIKSLEKIYNSQINILKNKDSIYNRINEISKYEENISKIVTILNQYNELKYNSEDKEKEIKIIELKLKNKKDDFNNFKKEIKICPLCGGLLDG